jgi:hypothetical protein
MRMIQLVLEVVLILLRRYYDPARMQEEVNERLERERQERQGDFRRAIDQKDADGVSGMLARLRDRLRNKNGVPGR